MKNPFRRPGRLAAQAAKTPHDSREQFVSDLALMKVRAMRLGLYATGQRIEPAIRMAGFELAGDIEACLRYEECEARAVAKVGRR